MFFLHLKHHVLLVSLYLFISIRNISSYDTDIEDQSIRLNTRTSSSSSHQTPFDETNTNELWNNTTLSTSTDPCLSLSSCTSCYNYSSKCHWCGPDEKCHSKGSIHGCLYGKSCSPTPPPDRNDTRCNKITNCTECGSSYLGSCHWCEFDNKCHAKGSVYGCMYGVDCYSNTRCQRESPEYVVDDGSSAPVGFLMIVLFVFSIGLCCCTTCFCVVRYSKGAYDDLTGLILKESKSSKKVHFEDDLPSASAPLLQDNGDHDLDIAIELSKQETPTPCLVKESTTPTNRNANYIYQTCKLFYILSVITLFLIAFSTVYYYPTEPEYNFCNNEFDWKSIIQGMTSFKMEGTYVLFHLQSITINPLHYTF